VIPTAAPAVSASPSVSVIVRPVNVPAAFRSADASAGPYDAVLDLGLTGIPRGGGIYEVYLVDPSSPKSRGIHIGRIGIEGPSALQVRDVSVPVSLDGRALAVLRASSTAHVRIVPRTTRSAPLRVRGTVALHPTAY